MTRVYQHLENTYLYSPLRLATVVQARRRDVYLGSTVRPNFLGDTPRGGTLLELEENSREGRL